jgi:peptidoglycan/xylan/chitin deacetylase (PgdA/CDA1 family)
VKNLIKKLFFLSGYYKLHRRLRSAADKRLIIIMYHDLIEDQEAGGHAKFWGDKPTRSQFASHLQASTKFYRVISVEDAVDEISRDGQLAEDSVAITFDDGYASVYTIAFPLLKEYNVPATVFVLTDWINKKLTPWWEQLTAMFNVANFKAVDSVEICRIFRLEPNDKLTKLSDTESVKRELQDRIKTALRDKADDERRELMDRLKTVLIKNDNWLSAGAEPMTWAEIREMVEAGIRFGAHTCSHINLRYADPELIEKEIVESKQEIEHHINREVKGFAYPYGRDLAAYSKAEPILHRYKYAYACTAYQGNNDGQSNRFALRRNTLPLTTSITLLGSILTQDLMETNQDPTSDMITI